MKSVALFDALMLSLVSGSWTQWYLATCPMHLTNYTLSSTDSSAYITEICVRTENTSFPYLISITATYNNGDVSASFSDSTTDSTIDCFSAIEDNECMTGATIFTGYVLNFLRFQTSSSRQSDGWGITSGNNLYEARGDDGTCLSKIEVTATSSWNR
eukprot:386230_1